MRQTPRTFWWLCSVTVAWGVINVIAAREFLIPSGETIGDLVGSPMYVDVERGAIWRRRLGGTFEAIAYSRLPDLGSGAFATDIISMGADVVPMACPERLRVRPAKREENITYILAGFPFSVLEMQWASSLVLVPRFAMDGSPEIGAHWTGIVLTAGVIVGIGVFAQQFQSRLISNRRSARGQCENCGYPRSGAARCPECGWEGRWPRGRPEV